MRKKLKIDQLQIRSFITTKMPDESHTLRGGTKGQSEPDACPYTLGTECGTASQGCTGGSTSGASGADTNGDGNHSRIRK